MSASQVNCYVEPPDIPEGMTLAEYRRRRARPARGLRNRLRRYAGRVASGRKSAARS